MAELNGLDKDEVAKWIKAQLAVESEEVTKEQDYHTFIASLVDKTMDGELVNYINQSMRTLFYSRNKIEYGQLIEKIKTFIAEKLEVQSTKSYKHWASNINSNNADVILTSIQGEMDRDGSITDDTERANLHEVISSFETEYKGLTNNSTEPKQITLQDISSPATQA